jgi:hypothetical protein
MYQCEYCGNKKQFKKNYDRHIVICKYIHGNAFDRDSQETVMPTLPVLLQYVLDLTEKITMLENTVEKLKKQSITKKSVYEYLQTIKPAITFQQWLSECTVENTDLEILFEKNMMECIQSILFRRIEAYQEDCPVKCFAQKANSIFVYENSNTATDTTSSNCRWRTMDPEEFKTIIQVISHRINRKYFQWKLENQYEIESSDKMRELQMKYLTKFVYNMEKCVSDVKKALVQKIQLSLKYIE